MAIFRATVVLTSACLGGHGTNTWHFRTDSDDIVPNLVSVHDAEDALQNFYIAVKDLWPAGTTASHNGEWATVNDEEPEVLDGFQWTQSGGAGEPLPPANCIVVGWKTTRNTRYGRGRTFLGPIGEGWNEEGTPSAAALTIARDGSQDLVDWNSGVLSGSSAFGVWSEHSATAEPAFRDFTSRTVHDKFAVLRSRRD